MKQVDEESLRQQVHTIRNALNTIAMNTEVIRMVLERGDTAAGGEAVDIIIDQCARCSDQLEELGQTVGIASSRPEP